MTWMEAGLTPKQARFAHAYIRTLGNGPDAAEEAYNCSTRASARQLAHRNLHKASVRRYIELLLLDQKMYQPLVEAILRNLDAKKLIQVNGESMEWDDANAQLKTLRLVLRMLGFPV